MNKYTLGVAADKDSIVLIKKTKPAWQAGNYNFVGGKVEIGESFPSCMVREFFEETGVKTVNKDWIYVGKMHRKNDFICKIYATSVPQIAEARTMTEEEIVIVNPDKFLLDSELQSNMLTNILTIYNFIVSHDHAFQNAILDIKYP